MFRSLFSSLLIGQLSRDSAYSKSQLFPFINSFTLALLDNHIVGIFLSTLLVIPNALAWALLHSWRSPVHIIEGLWLHLIKIPSIVAYEWFSLIQPPFDLIRQHTGKFLLLAASSIMLAFFVPVLPILIRIIALNYGINTALLPIFDRLFPNKTHLPVALASIPNGAALLTQLKKSFYATMPMASYLPLIALPSTIILSYGYLSSHQIARTTSSGEPMRGKQSSSSEHKEEFKQFNTLIDTDFSLESALQSHNLICPITFGLAQNPVKFRNPLDPSKQGKSIYEKKNMIESIKRNYATEGCLLHPQYYQIVHQPTHKMTNRQINEYIETHMITPVSMTEYLDSISAATREQQDGINNKLNAV